MGTMIQRTFVRQFETRPTSINPRFLYGEEEEEEEWTPPPKARPKARPKAKAQAKQQPDYANMSSEELFNYLGSIDDSDGRFDIAPADLQDDQVSDEWVDYFSGNVQIPPADFSSHVSNYRLPVDYLGSLKENMTYVVSCNPQFAVNPKENIFCHTFEMIQSAQKEVFVSTYNFSDIYGAALLVEAIKRGVSVKLVVDMRRATTKLWHSCHDAMSAAQTVSNGSYDVKLMQGRRIGSGFVGCSHDKIVSVDSKYCVISSANFSCDSRLKNYEIGFFTNEEKHLSSVAQFVASAYHF